MNIPRIGILYTDYATNFHRFSVQTTEDLNTLPRYGVKGTGVTGPVAYHSKIYTLLSSTKTLTLKVTGTYSGSGSINVTVNGTDLATSSPVSITRTIAPSDTLSISCGGSVGYTTGGSYNMTITIT